MMQSRRSKRRTPSRPDSLLLLNQLRQLRVHVHAESSGRRYTPSRTPRVVSDNPWNRLVVTEESTSTANTATVTSFNSYAVYLLLTGQLGLQSFAPSIEMRFERVEMWNMGPVAVAAAPSPAPAAIIMDVFPLQTQTVLTQCIARLEDQPGKNQWACVGFEWPASHKNFVLAVAGSAPSSDPVIVRYYSSVGSSIVWVRFHVLWRPIVALPPMLSKRLQLLDIDDGSFELHP